MAQEIIPPIKLNCQRNVGSIQLDKNMAIAINIKKTFGVIVLWDIREDVIEMFTSSN
jgi:hypothetical protein